MDFDTPGTVYLQLRLGAQSVTLLSTLRDPTQLRQRQCATTHQYPFFYGSSEGRSRFGQKSTAWD